jgi:hypothetical protein
MTKKLLLLLLATLIAVPPVLFGQLLPAYPAPLQSESGEAETGEAPEDNPTPLQISGRTKLLLGLSLAVTGTGLTIVGELYRTPFQEARAAYKSIDPATASVAEIEAARKEFANKRLLHYIPLFSGLSMSGIGLFLTFDGAFSISIYEPSPYSPTPVIPEEQSGFVISRNFSGFVLRY